MKRGEIHQSERKHNLKIIEFNTNAAKNNNINSPKLNSIYNDNNLMSKYYNNIMINFQKNSNINNSSCLNSFFVYGKNSKQTNFTINSLENKKFLNEKMVQISSKSNDGISEVANKKWKHGEGLNKKPNKFDFEVDKSRSIKNKFVQKISGIEISDWANHINNINHHNEDFKSFDQNNSCINSPHNKNNSPPSVEKATSPNFVKKLKNSLTKKTRDFLNSVEVINKFDESFDMLNAQTERYLCRKNILRSYNRKVISGEILKDLKQVASNIQSAKNSRNSSFSSSKRNKVSTQTTNLKIISPRNKSIIYTPDNNQANKKIINKDLNSNIIEEGIITGNLKINYHISNSEEIILPQINIKQKSRSMLSNKARMRHMQAKPSKLIKILCRFEKSK